jgi:hypothetical protein
MSIPFASQFLSKKFGRGFVITRVTSYEEEFSASPTSLFPSGGAYRAIFASAYFYIKSESCQVFQWRLQCIVVASLIAVPSKYRWGRRFIGIMQPAGPFAHRDNRGQEQYKQEHDGKKYA